MYGAEGYIIHDAYHAYQCAICKLFISMLIVRQSKTDFLAEHRMTHFNET